MQRVLSGSKQEFQNLRNGGLLLILAFAEMMNSSSFKNKLGKRPFIEMVAMMLDNCENQKNQLMDEYRRALFLIVESIAKHNKILVNQHKEII